MSTCKVLIRRNNTRHYNRKEKSAKLENILSQAVWGRNVHSIVRYRDLGIRNVLLISGNLTSRHLVLYC
jgi:hypothetical protein